MAFRRGVLSSLLQSSATLRSRKLAIAHLSAVHNLPPPPGTPPLQDRRFISSRPSTLDAPHRSLQSSSVMGTHGNTLLKKHDGQANDNPQGPLSKRRVGSKLSAVDKRKFLINTLLDLKDSKESVYGTLDAWAAWEHNFPLVSLKRALIVLQKEEQWHRVVQVIKWMLSKGQGTTMGTYEQLIRALEKDNRAEEAHRMWVKKISHDLHSVPWQFCELMISIYHRNNMLDRLVKLFKALESYERRPPRKSIVQKMADACELLGLSEEKSRVLEKYSDLFNDPSKEHSKRPGKDLRKYAKKTGKEKNRVKEANQNVEADSGPSDEESC